MNLRSRQNKKELKRSKIAVALSTTLKLKALLAHREIQEDASCNLMNYRRKFSYWLDKKSVFTKPVLKTKKPLIFNQSGACCLYKSKPHQVLLQPFMWDHPSAVVFPPWAIFQRGVHQQLSRRHHQSALEWQSCLEQSSALLSASAKQFSLAQPLFWQFTREKRCLHLD